MVGLHQIEFTNQSAISKFVPFADRILLKKVVPVAKVASNMVFKKQTIGGILLPEESVPQRNECEVGLIALRFTGRLLLWDPADTPPTETSFPPLSRRETSRMYYSAITCSVLVPGFGGDRINVNNEEYLIFGQNDILGIFQ